MKVLVIDDSPNIKEFLSDLSSDVELICSTFGIPKEIKAHPLVTFDKLPSYSRIPRKIKKKLKKNTYGQSAIKNAAPAINRMLLVNEYITKRQRYGRRHY